MAVDTLTWLQEWYRSRCDGGWEHEKGLSIDTLDNPGWSVEADIGSIEVPEPVQFERSNTDWVDCRVEQGRFYGYGGPNNLQEVLEVLRAWVGWRPAGKPVPEIDGPAA
jgi:hypothetical protein